MTYIERLQLLERIDGFLKRKQTGTADELAERLGICRRSVFNHFTSLRNMGAEIDYCDYRKSYFYVNDKKARLPIVPKSNSDKLYGGESFLNFFSGVQNFCTPMNDLCNRLTNNEGQNDAGGFRFLGFGD